MSTDKRSRQKANRAKRIAAAEHAARRARIRSRTITYSVAAVVIVGVIVVIALLVRDDGNDEETTRDRVLTPDEVTETTSTTSTSSLPPLEEGECPATDGSSPRRIDLLGPQPECIDASASYTAVFDTSEGEIRVQLDTTNTPRTVDNFVTLARWHYYDGTEIFRSNTSIDIIQGGSPHTQSTADRGPGYTIADEPTFETGTDGQMIGVYTYEPGQLVMARRAVPDGAGAQFFFATGPNVSNLDVNPAVPGSGTYVPFGTTDEAGLEVLQKIMALHGPEGSSEGRPSETVTVNSVTILES